jgi:MFS family permease
MYIEFQTISVHGIDCNNGVPISGQESDSWKCKSSSISALIVGIIIVAAFFFCPIWHYLVPRYGKNNIWITGTIWFMIANILFLALQEGSIYIAILFSVLAGILEPLPNPNPFLTHYPNPDPLTLTLTLTL